jgi:RNA polymerase sigma-70 factor (ECF subfamily)
LGNASPNADWDFVKTMSAPLTNQHNDRTETFVQLLAKHDCRLQGFVMSLVPNWTDADEVLQETKLQLWREYDKYDATKDFGAWACTLAYYQVLSLRKRNHFRRATLSDAFLERVAAEASRDLEQVAERQRLFADCLASLQETKQALLKRCYGGQDTIVQIALQFGRKAESVRQELVRIRRTLYQCVERRRRREDSL